MVRGHVAFGLCRNRVNGINAKSNCDAEARARHGEVHEEVQRRGRETLSVMEVTQVVGVREVPAVAVAADAASARSSKRRKTAPQRPTEVVQTSSYLQLRSRRLFMTFRRPRLLAAKSAAFSTGPSVEDVSRCSSNVSGDVVVDEQEVDGLERLTCNFGSRRARETTPSRDARREPSDRKSTTATSTSRTKTEAEIEEFFAAAEREQAQRFAAEYARTTTTSSATFRWTAASSGFESSDEAKWPKTEKKMTCSSILYLIWYSFREFVVSSRSYVQNCTLNNRHFVSVRWPFLLLPSESQTMRKENSLFGHPVVLLINAHLLSPLLFRHLISCARPALVGGRTEPEKGMAEETTLPVDRLGSRVPRYANAVSFRRSSQARCVLLPALVSIICRA
ncbi:hypothetical protein MUK42_11544 [Musa troglodytarum]|uniref:Cyclin-dependent kinase inhibitor n=2 Tax=Musa troglodytarum TaxID=320322 RepID=A0A9E7GN31_9LILI|nr:hypothetical protein MUK42_11544 [Musa troglodytarum]